MSENLETGRPGETGHSPADHIEWGLHLDPVGYSENPSEFLVPNRLGSQAFREKEDALRRELKTMTDLWRRATDALGAKERAMEKLVVRNEKLADEIVQILEVTDKCKKCRTRTSAIDARFARLSTAQSQLPTPAAETDSTDTPE